MSTAIIAGLVTFIFTSALTIAGVGAAFILIPVFLYLGIEIHVSMTTALLLNSIAMIVASYQFIKHKLIIWKVAIPILVVATAMSPVGALVAQGLPAKPLKWMFVGFLLFAAVMMLFYRAKPREDKEASWKELLAYGAGVGGLAGFVGGLLGVGGGNIIVPVLVAIGFNPKKASATTSFIVIFSSFSGFLAHVHMSGVSTMLLVWTALGSAAGALLGAWLMTDKLNRKQVKLIIGIILLAISAKMVWKLVLG
ncbi:MAG: sulfite exporter TauE/SafE family protein [Deltaproteobacteria bacterium]|nr:sulfite exporter TauE/SafE family protein [Deltaproteobacteria bacterium]